MVNRGLCHLRRTRTHGGMVRGHGGGGSVAQQYTAGWGERGGANKGARAVEKSAGRKASARRQAVKQGWPRWGRSVPQQVSREAAVLGTAERVQHAFLASAY